MRSGVRSREMATELTENEAIHTSRRGEDRARDRALKTKITEEEKF